MTVEIQFPTGTTATFDGEHWTSSNPAWTPRRLEAFPVMVSASLSDWEYWHAAEVAEAIGAAVTTPAPVDQPDLEWDVDEGDDVALSADNEPVNLDWSQFDAERAAAHGRLASLPDAGRKDWKTVPFEQAIDPDLAMRVYRAADLTKPTIESVPLSDILATQETVQPEIVKKYIETPSVDLPMLIKHEGKYYVGDGHHKLTAEWAKDHTHAPAKVFEADPAHVVAPPAYEPFLSKIAKEAGRRRLREVWDDLIALSAESSDADERP